MALSIPESTSVSLPIILVAALVCGCAATPYQPLTDAGDDGEGFSETQLGPTVYEVSFRGNNATSRERAGDFALLRAAELCLLNGYRYFAVSSSEDLTAPAPDRTPQPEEIKTNSSANMFGVVPTGGSTTTYRGAARPTYTRPHPSMVLRFLEEPVEDRGTVYDAQSLNDSIRTKYAMVPLDILGDARDL